VLKFERDYTTILARFKVFLIKI